MEVIKKEIEYPSTNTVFKIYPLGDVHCGSVDCDEDAFQRKIKEIQDNPRALWVGMGDFCDCITQNDKRFDTMGLAKWVERDNIIESQRRWVVDNIRPIANKCIAYLTGNHEESIHKYHQNNITHNICDDLKIPYAGYSAFIILNFNRNKSNQTTQVTLHVRHGSGGAQSEGAVVLNLMRLVNAFTADIYLSAHLHKIATYCPERLEVDRYCKIRAKRIIAALTGSWLKAYQQGDSISYAEMKGYKPTQIGCPEIVVKPFNREFTLVS